MKIGYARVSTRDQKADLQVDALKQAGVIWKLDRLGRSLKHLVELVGELAERKVGLQSLNDPIDTTHAQGRLVFNLFASLAEFERELIRERTQAGLSAARARGRIGGRPKGLPAKAEATAMAAETLYREGRDRRVPEERQVTRPAAFGRVAGRAARRRAGGHRHPAPRGGE